MNLGDVFPWEDVDYRVLSLTNDKKKGQIAYYLDARAVMRRLDEAALGWSHTFREIHDLKHVHCSITIGDVTHEDFGAMNEGGQADGLKGAASDALKRAAVHFGVGRYLYDAPRLWVPVTEDRFPKPTDEGVRMIRQQYHQLIGGEKAQEGAPRPLSPEANQDCFKRLYSIARQHGYTKEQLYELAGVESMKGWTVAQVHALGDRMERIAKGEAV